VGINKQVFGSKPERAHFHKLSRQWGNRYNIYHNLPFLNVFNTEDLADYNTGERIKVSEEDRNRLKKTSIDFTLCDKHDRPIICIEFDGMKEGFNVGTSYVTEVPSNPWRKEITELKLRVAHGSRFPFFVLGTEYFKDISKDTRLMIVDGIIGEVLANRAARGRFDQGFIPEEVGYSQEEFEVFDPDEQHEIIQDWVLGVEVMTDLKYNPIHKKTAELSLSAGIYALSIKYLTHPNLDECATLEERIQQANSVILHGARVEVETPSKQRFEASVWLPNFRSPCITGLFLAQEIAHLIVLEKAISEGDSST